MKATANNARSLRPELISRFDDVFWVDLPNARGRAQILNVHFSKRGKNFGELFTGKEIEAMVNATWGFSGREIERIVKSALEIAFFQDREVTSADVIGSAETSVPTAQMMKVQIDELRAWAKSGEIRLADRPLEDRPAASAERTIELQGDL